MVLVIKSQSLRAYIWSDSLSSFHSGLTEIRRAFCVLQSSYSCSVAKIMKPHYCCVLTILLHNLFLKNGTFC